MIETMKLSGESLGKPYKQYWRTLACAGRAAEGLRAQWQQQLRRVQQEIGFSYIRFHGIFHDDMMVFTRLPDGTARYNWTYVDELFDFLQSVHIRPFLELGFMPSALASGDATCFWWKGNITPPSAMNDWTMLVDALVRHCIDRYGLHEVIQWYFEVWNEPNLFEYFWHATQDEYFDLYRATVHALKAIDPGLRVGGPATSNFSHGEAPWMRDFLAFCEREALPVDFVSSHPYPNHWPLDPSTGKRRIAYRGPEALVQDCQWLRSLVDASAYPQAEIHITEWNSSFVPWDKVHDTAFMGPFIVQNALNALGLVDSLGFWTFTDIFEETGAGYGPFHGGFGLMNTRGIPKPSFYAYHFLSRLGTTLIERGEHHVVTSEGDSIRILAWNYCHYNDSYRVGGQYDSVSDAQHDLFQPGESIHLELTLPADWKQKHAWASFSLVSPSAGSALDAWRSLGAPQWPTTADYAVLEQKAVPTQWTAMLPANEGVLRLHLEPHAMVCIEIHHTAQKEQL